MAEFVRRAAAALLLLLVGTPFAALPAGPREYRVKSAADLIALSDWAAAGHTFRGEKIRLVADIEINGALAPIGSPSAPFSGEFDGEGHALSALILRGGEFCGLFGYVGGEGVVKNVTLKNILVSGERYAGALAAYNAGQILSCRVEGQSRVQNGSISQFGSATGGIAGLNTGLIENCRFEGAAVAGVYRVGGVAGVVSGGRLRLSGNSARVESRAEGQACVGGVVGLLRLDGLVAVCENRGDVAAEKAQWVGGVAGSVQGGRLRACRSVGDVEGEHPSGGVVGFLAPDSLAVQCISSLSACPLPALGAGYANSARSVRECWTALDAPPRTDGSPLRPEWP